MQEQCGPAEGQEGERISTKIEAQLGKGRDTAASSQVCLLLGETFITLPIPASHSLPTGKNVRKAPGLLNSTFLRARQLHLTLVRAALARGDAAMSMHEVVNAMTVHAYLRVAGCDQRLRNMADMLTSRIGMVVGVGLFMVTCAHRRPRRCAACSTAWQR